MTPRQSGPIQASSSLGLSDEDLAGFPSMKDVPNWSEPAETQFPSMAQAKPWTQEDEDRNLPNMNQVPDWKDPVKPPASPEIPDDNAGPPGWIDVAKSAFGRKAAERAADDAMGMQILLPSGVGGHSFEEQYQKGLATPAHKDYTDKLLGQGIGEGWTNPHWWVAQLAGNLGGVTPGLAAAGAASLTPAGPIGGIAAFGAEAAIGNLPSAYRAARQSGLDENAAIRQAITTSGLSAAFAVGMGIVGKFNITGALAGKLAPYINENIVAGLQRPVTEAMVQLGLVQPGLMASQDVATSLATTGQLPGGDQLLTDMAVGGLAGLGIHEVFKTGERISKARESREEPEKATATEDVIGEAQAAQAAQPGFQRRFREGTEPAAPVGVAQGQEPGDPDVPADGHSYEVDLTPKTRKDGAPMFQGTEPDAFFSQLGRVVDDMPDSMPVKDVMPYLKKRGVKDAELNDAFIPQYLGDVSGKANKEDLMAWIESNRVQVWERVLQDQGIDPMAKANELYDHYKETYGTGNQRQWAPRAQRHMEQVFRQARIDAEKAAKEGPQYAAQALPGLKDNPIEVTFRTPPPKYAPEQIDQKAKEILASPEGWGGPAKGMERNWDRLSSEEQDRYRQQANDLLMQADPNTFTGSHYSDPNTFAHTRMYFKKDRDGQWTAIVAEMQSDAHQKAAKQGYVSEGGKIADLPFKSNWHELLAKRIMQLAANRGVTRVAWYNGDQVGMRLENRAQLEGARANYDKKIPSAFEKIAKQFGERTGETNFNERPDDPYGAMRPGDFLDQLKDLHREMGLDMNKVKGPLRYVTISPAMAENLFRHGQAFYDADPQVKSHPARGTKTLSDFVEKNITPQHLVQPMKKLDKAFHAMANEFKLTRGFDFVQEMDPNAKYRGFLAKGVDPATGNYKVHVNLSRIMTEHDLYASMSHEFGHVIKENLFEQEPRKVQAPIWDSYNKWLARQNDPQRQVGMVRRERDNAISLMTGARGMHDHYKLSDLVPRSKDYFLGFDEYFAEQVAKWMQTDAKPLGIVDKFFKKVSNTIRKMVTKFRQMDQGGRENPDAAVADWLNSKFGAPTDWAEPHKQQFDMDTTKKAQESFDKEGAPETRAVPMQGSSAGGRNIIDNLPPEVRGNGDAMAAHGDRMNWFYKTFMSLPQIQQLNQHLRQLGLYTSMHRNANVEKNIIMGEAHRRLEQWSKLNQKELFALTNFIQDYAHMDHRPNAQEFRDLVNQHKLSNQGVKLFQGVVSDFDGFLEKYRNLLINDALRIKDPNRRQNNLSNINSRFDELLRRPFMPITHFGKYSITVYDQANNITHYEQTNSLKRQGQIKDLLEASKDRLPGDRVLAGMVPKDVTPFLGMPPGMIDLIGDKLSLSATQRGALDQLRFDYAPAQTFKHQFRNLDLVPGYSTDFMRAYAHFFFHGANHVTRIKWVDAMRDQIRSLGSASERLARAGDRTGSNKLDKIVKYMQGHFDAWVDPKPDWAALRGLMFHQYLGMSPVAAMNNLTQTALSTYPWMASKYGDFHTMRALAKASTDLNNFYKKGTMQDQAKGAPPGPEGAWLRAAGESVNEGVISETQGHQLAAVSEDRNLLRAFGKKGEKAWLKFQEASSWMFDLSEQYNRRVAFRAAWDMAMKFGPDHKAVREAILQDPILYQKLIDTEAKGGKNWSKQEAGAFMAAKHAVEATQFEYQPFARPAFMQGRLGVPFIFKQFTQNMLFNLWNNPGMAVRWAVIMGAMGGLGGLAGYENVNSIIKTIAGRVFGKDFDLDDEVRHFAHDVLNDVIPPDILLHGLAVKGFGIPHVMHSVGANWFPTVDLSKSVGMGDILGFDPMKLTGLAPSLHPREEELRQLSRASGAAFAIPFSLFDFASSNENFTSLKKYEPLMPHWMGALSHAWRWYDQGRETNAAGNTTIRFNPQDTEHMTEILARAMGFQPRRLTEEWERTQALKESSDFWDLRRQTLIRQYGDAVKNEDSEGADKVAEAVANYNDQLPDEARAKAITGKALRTSARQRMGVAEKTEEGIPTQKSNIPLLEAMEPYYPRGWPKGLIDAGPVQ